MNSVFLCFKRKNSIGKPIYVGFKNNRLSMKVIDHMKDERVYLIRITKLKEQLRGCYYGWLDFSDSEVYHINATRGLVSNCFPHGYKKMEEMGQGQLIYISVSEIMSYANIDKAPDNVKDLPDFLINGD
jgi:Tat protein secretion system quality control protein TatD with DNase activity